MEHLIVLGAGLHGRVAILSLYGRATWAGLNGLAYIGDLRWRLEKYDIADGNLYEGKATYLGWGVNCPGHICLELIYVCSKPHFGSRILESVSGLPHCLMAGSSNDAFPIHAWELGSPSMGPVAPGDHDWEQEPTIHESGWGDPDDTLDLDEIDEKEVVSGECLATLMNLYMFSSISAESVCTLCWWAHRAGMVGEQVQALGQKPGGRSGHYSRHLKKNTGFAQASDKCYVIDVPGTNPHELDRCTHELPVLPIHEVIYNDVQDNPEMLDKAKSTAEYRALPPAYYEHPIVQAADTPPIPLGLYMDAFTYSLTDSVVGIWVINLLAQARHNISFVRKKYACKCGCKGWCTRYPLKEAG